MALVLVQLGGERGEQHVDQGVQVPGGLGPIAVLGEQGPDVGPPEPVGAGGEAPGPSGGGPRSSCSWSARSWVSSRATAIDARSG
jgi:hypothetical protein